MARRKRSDSAESGKEALQRALRPIEPPAHMPLTDTERKYWDAIVTTRAIWTPNDLIIAAQLAKIEAEIAAYWELVSERRRVVIKDQRVKASPIHQILQDLISTQTSLCRTLQIHARATQGESRDQAKQNALYREAQNTASSLDSLIARPTLQ